MEVLVKLQTTEKLIIYCFYMHVALISHPQVHCQFVWMLFWGVSILFLFRCSEREQNEL